MKPFGTPLRKVLQKVVGVPTREPINRQAALAISPAPRWAAPFPAEKEKPPLVQALLEENANMKAKLTAKHLELAALRRRLDRAERHAKRLEKFCSDVIAKRAAEIDALPPKERNLEQTIIKKSILLQHLISH